MPCSRLVVPAFLCALGLVLGSCKNTEDYLTDIKTSQDSEGKLNLLVYDAGLLIHEGLTGIMDEEVLTLSQMGRAVHDCGWIVEKNEIALCRADAVSLLVHVALRYPLPPLDEPYRPEKAGEVTLKQLELLDEDTKLIEVETKIPMLASPDRVVQERAYHELKTLTGQSFPLDTKPWQQWWDAQKPQVIAAVGEKAREPLEVLAGLRYGSLPNARSVLRYLALWVGTFDVPPLRELLQRAVTRIARQVVVHGIQTAIRDREPVVRIAAARAASEILDPSFGEVLVAQIKREADPDVRCRFLAALRYYPAKTTVEELLVALKDPERAVRIHAHRSLVAITGLDLGESIDPWLSWYDHEGKLRWP